MAQVLLTHSYHLPFDPKQTAQNAALSCRLARSMQPRHLRASGISVAAFDSMLEDPSAEFSSALEKHRPKIVAVYEDDFNFLSKMCLTRMRDVAWEIAQAARQSAQITVVHGSDSTDNPLLFLENGFDYVLCGEAEESPFAALQLHSERGRQYQN